MRQTTIFLIKKCNNPQVFVQFSMRIFFGISVIGLHHVQFVIWHPSVKWHFIVRTTEWEAYYMLFLKWNLRQYYFSPHYQTSHRTRIRTGISRKIYINRFSVTMAREDYQCFQSKDQLRKKKTLINEVNYPHCDNREETSIVHTRYPLQWLHIITYCLRSRVAAIHI